MTYLIDSNIFIYASNAESDEEASYQFLTRLDAYHYASVTKIEVLGYHQLDSEDKEILEEMFIKGKEIPLSKEVEDKAIELRQERKMSLGDSIIAASALIFETPLVTRNIEDFSHLADLLVYTPYQPEKMPPL